MPKVSVIMPVFNAERYLKKAVDCVLNQSFADFELIIVDDCGTDSGMQIIQNMTDARITVVHNEKNMGIAYSRNAGLKHARGEYIALMDDDDLCPTDRFEIQVNYLESHPDIDVVGGRYQIIDEADHITHIASKPVNNPNHIKTYMMFYDQIANGSAMFRKKLIDEHNIWYRDDLLGMEDYGFWIDCSLYGRMTNLPRILLSWRQSDTGETFRSVMNDLDNRKTVYAKLQRDAIIKNGFKLGEDELSFLSKMFPEDMRKAEAVAGNTEELSRIFMKMTRQAEIWNLQNKKELGLCLENMVSQARELETLSAREQLNAMRTKIKGPENRIPFLSIVVLCYQVEEWLPECLESLLNQTFKDFEAIMVDDGSTDGSGAICDYYAHKDSRFRAIHRKNGGIVSARKTGINAARGLWCGSVDGDDWIEPDMFEKMVRAQRQYGADIVQCGEVRHQGDEGVINCRSSSAFYDEKAFEKGLHEQACRRMAFLEVSLCRTILKTEKLREICNLVEDGCNLCEDAFSLVIYASQAKSMYDVSEPLYHYRFREGSCTMTRQLSDTHGLYRLFSRAESEIEDSTRKDDLLKWMAVYYIMHCTSTFFLKALPMEREEGDAFIRNEVRNPGFQHMLSRIPLAEYGTFLTKETAEYIIFERMPSARHPLKARKDFSMTKYGDRYVVMYTGSGKDPVSGMFVLNDTAAFLWELLLDGSSEEELVSALMGKYDIERETAWKDVRRIVDSFRISGALQ